MSNTYNTTDKCLSALDLALSQKSRLQQLLADNENNLQNIYNQLGKHTHDKHRAAVRALSGGGFSFGRSAPAPAPSGGFSFGRSAPPAVRPFGVPPVATVAPAKKRQRVDTPDEDN